MKKKSVSARDLLRRLAASGRLKLADYIRLDLALEETGESDREASDLRSRMLKAMARFAYVLAWDTMNNYRLEDSSKYAVHIPGGSQIEDYVPKRTPASANAYAKKLMQKIEEINHMPIEAIFISAMIADSSVGIDDAEDFASDLVYPAMGHGVSWFDDHKELDFELKIPHMDYYI